MESNTRTEYQYWQKKQTGEVFAIKLCAEHLDVFAGH